MTVLELVPLMSISNALFVSLIYLLKVCLQNNDAFDMRIFQESCSSAWFDFPLCSYRCPGLDGCLLSLLENDSNASNFQAFRKVLSCS